MAVRDLHRHDHDGAVLITGATGFIGMEILARFLERDDRHVYVLVRARDYGAAAERLANTLECFFGRRDAHADQVTAIPADIERPGLGLPAQRRAALAEAVTTIVHSAASVSFTLPLEQSRRINVDGTAQMLEFAELCRQRGELDRFSYISTAYVAGAHAGRFGEDQLDIDQGFRNPYEQSKFEAETLVRAWAEHLPIEIFRPSIVVGEQATGWTAAFNVLYTPMKAFARGSLPALPARRSSPVDVVPVDYVADAVFELSRQPVCELQTYHLVAGRKATTVGRLIELTADRLGRRPPVVIPPPAYRRLIYPILVRGARERVRRGLERSRVFFPYFEMDVIYDDRRARGALARAGIEVPSIESYFERLMQYAERAQWGRAPLTRAECARCHDGRLANPVRAGDRQPALTNS